MSYQAIKLKEYIEKLDNFEIITPDIPYNHMGATICDAILQAGLNWESVVKPRLEKIKKQFPDCCTTSSFRDLLILKNIKEIIDWDDDEKPNRIEGVLKFFIQERIQTESDLREWLENEGNISRLKRLRGIGDKTADYIKWLVGIPTTAIDRHMIKFLKEAKLSPTGYQDAQNIIHDTADLINLNRTVLDHSIWKYMSRKAAETHPRKEKRELVECGASAHIFRHDGNVSLSFSFDYIWDYLNREKSIILKSNKGKQFKALAMISKDGRRVIRFLQNDKEYARAYECCWGKYYNCNGTRFGMYAKKLDEEIKYKNIFKLLEES